MALQTAAKRRQGQVRERSLESREAVAQRQPDRPAECDHDRPLLSRKNDQAHRLRPHRRVIDGGPSAPLGNRPMVEVVPSREDESTFSASGAWRLRCGRRHFAGSADVSFPKAAAVQLSMPARDAPAREACGRSQTGAEARSRREADGASSRRTQACRGRARLAGANAGRTSALVAGPCFD